MLFEIKTQIMERLSEQSTPMQEKRDEQTSEPAIAVEERMDRLELHMGQGSLDQQRQARGVFVEKRFQIGHARLDLAGRWWHEVGLTRTRAPIQFWLRRNSPDSFSLPRPRAISLACISRSRRLHKGNPSRRRAMP